MSPPSDPRGASQQPQPARAGMCDTCEHQQTVRNTRGSAFSLCRRSRDDSAYPRYPRLPVLSCPGYEVREVLGASHAPED